MTTRILFIVFFTILLLYMVFTTITTSLASNLFTEWDYLASIPWMKATLIDFYINTIVLYAWIFFREKSLFSRIIWLPLLVFLGSMAATLYVILQLLNLKPGDSVALAFIISTQEK